MFLFLLSSVVVVVCCFVLVLVLVFVPTVLGSEKIYHKNKRIPENAGNDVPSEDDDEDSHSRCSAVLDELSIGLTSELSDLLDCVRVHCVGCAAHDAIPVSFSADLPFPTAVLSY